jgi:hypothetical protein
MGALNSVADRVPPLQANDAAVQLTALVNKLTKNETVDAFVAREIARGELTIGAPPALPDISAIRELLLRKPIVWKRVDGIGGDNDSSAVRTVQMTAARSLVASALAKARANDPAAWEDLHAAWNLALSLNGHPQMMVQTAASSMARMINAVAWKMPLPAQAWLGELHAATADGRSTARSCASPARSRPPRLPRPADAAGAARQAIAKRRSYFLGSGYAGVGIIGFADPPSIE